MMTRHSPLVAKIEPRRWALPLGPLSGLPSLKDGPEAFQKTFGREFMSKGKLRRPSAYSKSVPQTGDPETPKRRRPNLDRTMRQFAARLKRKFAGEIQQNPTTFKRRAVHSLKLNLPPGPGRPSHANVTRAVGMRDAGKNWQEIYPECIPNFANLDPASRQVARWNLRAAVRSRRNAAKRRTHPKTSG